MKRTVSRDAGHRVGLRWFMLFDLFLPDLSSYFSPLQLTFRVKMAAAAFPGVWSVTAALTATTARTRSPVPP